ncbi:MAG: DUF1674 domain-containing protein [Gammaproteobacteria bacterium]
MSDTQLKVTTQTATSEAGPDTDVSDTVSRYELEPDQATETALAGATSGAAQPREFGGPKGPEPTRYGDWEKNGQCIDF